jgi:hypothetical protein
VSARCALVVHLIALWKADLRGDHYLIAAIGDETTKDCFGTPIRVAVGTIEEIDANVAAAIEHPRGFRFICAIAKGHRSEA